MNVYHSVSREQIENYLYKLTYGLIIDVVEEKAAGIQIAEGDKKFIADFYKYSFVGIMLDWIKQGMKADYQIIVEKMCTMIKGSVDNSIHNFMTKGKG